MSDPRVIVGGMNNHAEQPPSVPVLRRSAVVFPVRDLAASLAFYERLGLRTASYDPHYGFARRERLRLHLRVVPEFDPARNESGVYVHVSAVDALHAEWLRCGPWDGRAGRITDAVEAKPWGVREFTVLDPDDNRLRFGEDAGHAVPSVPDAG